MKRLILAIAAAALVCGGCVRPYGDTSLYQTSGRHKAVVAVLPVINQTSMTNIPWDLSQELTEEIRKKVYESKRIYLHREPTSLEVAQLLSVPNPQSISSRAAESLGDAEYAIVTEVIEQKEKAFKARSELGAILTFALRVRVLDLRQSTPKVILQEVLDKDYVVAKPYMHCDYEKMGWGTEAFNYTPMGMAHSRLVRELVSRAEAYIEASL